MSTHVMTKILEPIDEPAASDSSAVVEQSLSALTLTNRLFCKRHRPDIDTAQADALAREAIDTVTRRERVNPAYVSQAGLAALTDKVIEQLGLAEDKELLAELNAHLARLAADLPARLTIL